MSIYVRLKKVEPNLQKRGNRKIVPVSQPLAKYPFIPDKMSQVCITHKIRSLVEKSGGMYEPHCKLHIGEVSDIVEIHKNYIVVNSYCGFVLNLREFEVVGDTES